MQHQLFIRPFEIQGRQIIISDYELIWQTIRVLRANIWYECVVQDIQHRYQIRYTQISKHEIRADVIQITHRPDQILSLTKNIIVGIPNKVSKIELLAQKVAEIGIDHIVLVPMCRSIITQIPDHRLDRIRQIILEACEQSRSRNIPSLTVKSRSQVYQDHTPQHTVYAHTHEIQRQISEDQHMKHITAMIIWPEWGFDPKEIQTLQDRWYRSYSFPTGVLRTETASICGAYQLCCRWSHLWPQ